MHQYLTLLCDVLRKLDHLPRLLFTSSYHSLYSIQTVTQDEERELCRLFSGILHSRTEDDRRTTRYFGVGCILRVLFRYPL